MVKIVGNIHALDRVVTGLWSFDLAFNPKTPGYPMRSINEVFGPTHCGKSTITYSLSGIIASKLSGSVALADFEGFDPNFISSVYDSVGFADGQVFIASGKTDEETLDDLVQKVRKDAIVGILDSVGAISPISEQEGEIGDANMGRRAKAIAQFSRKAVNVLLENGRSPALFCINHVHPNLGMVGTSTPGGKTLEYLAHIRTRLKQVEMFKDGLAYHVKGTVVKNKFGPKNGEFNLVVVSGRGVHPGLTALIDCVTAKMVEVKNGVVRVGEEKHGRFSGYLQGAIDGKDEMFDVFHQLLQGADPNAVKVEGVEDE